MNSVLPRMAARGYSRPQHTLYPPNSHTVDPENPARLRIDRHDVVWPLVVYMMPSTTIGDASPRTGTGPQDPFQFEIPDVRGIYLAQQAVALTRVRAGVTSASFCGSSPARNQPLSAYRVEPSPASARPQPGLATIHHGREPFSEAR